MKSEILVEKGLQPADGDHKDTKELKIKKWVDEWCPKGAKFMKSREAMSDRASQGGEEWLVANNMWCQKLKRIIKTKEKCWKLNEMM